MYDPNSCNALEKPFYSPLEAAIRWCGLIKHEAEILDRMELVSGPVPPVALFPQWSCLRANAETILYAMECGELPYGRDGKTVDQGDHVAPNRRTVRHTDLKGWMLKHYPDKKPSFLFDEIERTTHTGITIEAFQTLQAERDALQVRVRDYLEMYHTKWVHLERENAALKDENERARGDVTTSHLLLIAELLEMQKAPVKHPRPNGKNQEAIKNEILEGSPPRGLSASNLEKIFSAANKAIADARKN